MGKRIGIVFVLLLCLTGIKAQMPFDKYVVLDKDEFELSLEPYTLKRISKERISPEKFVKEKWQHFSYLNQTTLFMNASRDFSYLAIGFKNREINTKNYIINLKQSVFPTARFYWISTDKDSVYEIFPRSHMRTIVLDLPKLNRLHSGILLMELLPLENASSAPIFLFEQNAFYDQELNIVFLYSIMFGLLLLEFLLALYSIVLSKKLSNLSYTLIAVCVFTLLAAYNGFGNLFVDRAIQLPPNFLSILLTVLNIFFMFFLYNTFEQGLPKWIFIVTKYSMLFYLALLVLIFIDGILAHTILTHAAPISLVFAFVCLTVACRTSFFRYIYFLFGVLLLIVFYFLQFSLINNWIPNMPLAFYGFDIGLSCWTLFFTLGLIRNVFAGRLEGERLIKENQIELIEAETRLNQKIEEENKNILTETDDIIKKVSLSKSQLQTRKQSLLKKEAILDEIENVIQNADKLIEETKQAHEKYLNQSKDQIFILDNSNGHFDFINTAALTHLQIQGIKESDNLFDLFAKSEHDKLQGIIQRAFKGYYFSTALKTPFLVNDNQSDFDYEFAPVKRSNGRVIKVLCYSKLANKSV